MNNNINISIFKIITIIFWTNILCFLTIDLCVHFLGKEFNSAILSLITCFLIINTSCKITIVEINKMKKNK